MKFDIPFSGRAHAYIDEELSTIVRVARDAVPLTQGSYQTAFESDFSEYVGGGHAFAMSNATAALEVAGQLCRFSPGDEIIIPSHTFTASAYPFLKHGATPVWADIDPTTRVVTVDTLRVCLTERTRAIVVVHLYGYGADMPEIMQFAREHDLLVIEDCAQSLGVDVDNKQVGTYGDFGVYSFHSHKNVTTLGEGGVLLVQDPKLASVIPMLRHNGHCAFSFERDDYWVPAMGNVDLPELDGHTMMPNNFCLSEVQCALGSKLLERVEAMNLDKRQRALRFIDSLSDYPELVFHREDSRRHNYHLLAARVSSEWRDKFIRTMADNESIQCVVQYCPLNRYDYYRKLGFGTSACPVSDDFFDNMVSFPFTHTLHEAELVRIAEAARRVIDWLRQEV